jgi:CHASE2 domain-containing sensor protein
VIATVALTLFHFTDNTISIDTYPAPSWQPDWFEWVVALSWPVFTAFGVLGYRWYKRGEFGRAHVALIVYSYTGLVSLGHFTAGGPDDLTTRALVSVVIDVVAGSVVLAVTIRSIIARRRQPSAA